MLHNIMDAWWWHNESTETRVCKLSMGLEKVKLQNNWFMVSVHLLSYGCNWEDSKGPSKWLQHPFHFVEWQCWKRFLPPFPPRWIDVERVEKPLKFASTSVQHFFCSLECSECWSEVEVICFAFSTLLSKRMRNQEDVIMVTMDAKTKQDNVVCGCSTSGPRCGKPD